MLGYKTISFSAIMVHAVEDAETSLSLIDAAPIDDTNISYYWQKTSQFKAMQL
jgi:hypothetical protein